MIEGTPLQALSLGQTGGQRATPGEGAVRSSGQGNGARIRHLDDFR